jgi:DNA-binding Xre family transcriptional regulator
VKSVTLGSILKLSHALGCAPGGLLADFTQSQIRKLVR